MMTIGHRRGLFACFLVQAIYCALASVASAQVEAPRTLAFVVGIEHYADAELDKLTFAADDAKRIFDQLRSVTELDPRSVLLVADDDDRSPVNSESLRVALQRFVRLIGDNTNVVVYLGGHGTTSPSRALWYLPSNYSSSEQTGQIPFAEIASMFADWVNGQVLNNVPVTFLVNMCGAGNAASVNLVQMNDDRELIDVARRVFRDQSFGFKRYAIIPATPRNRNTFEDSQLKGSVFAHHLQQALSGRAARDGVIMSGTLLRYMEDALKEDLPENQNFNPDIRLGVTRRVEGEADYLAGTALLAAARTLETASASDQLDHRDAVLDLAAAQLKRVRAADLELRTALRRAQTEILRNRKAPPVDDARLASLVGATENASAEKDEFLQLINTPQQSPLSTLKSLRDELQRGEPFYALIVDTKDRFGTEQSQHVTAWATLLGSFSGRRAINSAVLPIVAGPELEPPAMGRLAGIVERWAAETQKDVPRPARLLIVYVGMASANELVRGAGNVPRLFPFGKEEIDSLITIWKGPVSVFYLAPFGGLLLASDAAARDDVSLMLAAGERNGMTFSTPDRLDRGTGTSHAVVIAQGFQEGVDNFAEYPPFSSLMARVKDLRLSDSDWVPGTPKWIPNRSEPTVKPVAAKQLAPLDRFVFHVAAGCVSDSLTACDAASVLSTTV
jgi:hypothetical protein